MSEIVKASIFGSVTFVIVFLIYYFLILKPKFDEYNGKKKKKSKKKQQLPLDFMEFSYLVNKFNLDKEKINVLYIFRIVAILNAFIIAFTGTLLYYIPVQMMWKFLIGFVLLFGLIYSLYEIFGRHLVKKGWSKK